MSPKCQRSTIRSATVVVPYQRGRCVFVYVPSQWMQICILSFILSRRSRGRPRGTLAAAGRNPPSPAFPLLAAAGRRCRAKPGWRWRRRGGPSHPRGGGRRGTALPAEARRSAWGGAAELRASVGFPEVRRRRGGCAAVKVVARRGFFPRVAAVLPLAAATRIRLFLAAWCCEARRSARRRRWRRGLPAAAVAPLLCSEPRPRSAQMGLGGPGRACSRQQAARGAWSAAGRRGGAGVRPGDGGGWIPSVQPRLGGSVDRGGTVVSPPAPRHLLRLASLRR
jgi:hypothetical protein